MVVFAEVASAAHLVSFCDGDVLLDAERPVDVQHVLVQRQHEHDEDEESIEHGEVEDSHVPQLLQPLFDFFLREISQFQ